ncbi:hypothetical protein [Roseibium album]|uniref:hypothetical protein n=1 Tax=Roseibium album TaxID=311410 RepID=UPI0032EAA1A3
MSVAGGHPGDVLRAHAPIGLPVKSLGNGALWLAAFLSGFVIEEPAPYELYMALLCVVWLACGLRLRREFGPLIICLMLFVTGGLASVPLANEFGEAAMYIAVTGFLAITSIFYAAILADDSASFRTATRSVRSLSPPSELRGIFTFFRVQNISRFTTGPAARSRIRMSSDRFWFCLPCC